MHFKLCHMLQCGRATFAACQRVVRESVCLCVCNNACTLLQHLLHLHFSVFMLIAALSVAATSACVAARIQINQKCSLFLACPL